MKPLTSTLIITPEDDRGINLRHDTTSAIATKAGAKAHQIATADVDKNGFLDFVIFFIGQTAGLLEYWKADGKGDWALQSGSALMTDSFDSKVPHTLPLRNFALPRGLLHTHPIALTSPRPLLAVACCPAGLGSRFRGRRRRHSL